MAPGAPSRRPFIAFDPPFDFALRFGYPHPMGKTRAIFLTVAAPQAGGGHDAPLCRSPVKAGFPAPAKNCVEQGLDLCRYILRNETATFFLHASGQPMGSAGIHDGNLLAAGRSAETADCHMDIAAMEGKPLPTRQERKDGRAWLKSESPDYRTSASPGTRMSTSGAW